MRQVGEDLTTCNDSPNEKVGCPEACSSFAGCDSASGRAHMVKLELAYLAAESKADGAIKPQWVPWALLHPEIASLRSSKLWLPAKLRPRARH